MIKKRFQVAAACFITLASLLLTSCGNAGAWIQLEQTLLDSGGNYETIGEVPDYGGDPYVEINDNEPEFTEEELTVDSYETYSELDSLGRCGTAQACVGEDLMPDEAREEYIKEHPRMVSITQIYDMSCIGKKATDPSIGTSFAAMLCGFGTTLPLIPIGVCWNCCCGCCT